MNKFSKIKKIVVCVAIAGLIFPGLSLGATSKTTVAKKTVKAVAVKPKPVDPKTYWGRFIVQTESYNKLWYSDKATGKRYYIKEDADLDWLINKYGKKITPAELKAIRTNAAGVQTKTGTKYLGQLVYASSTENGVWYVNSGDGIRYPVEDFSSFYKIMKIIGLKLSNVNLKKLPMNSEQLTYDPTFAGTAYVRYDGNNFANYSYPDTILPLASLSKLMTALVLEGLPDIDWNKQVIITDEEINYPSIMVGGDATSEVSLKAGDTVYMYDLWTSMLTASSNQSAVILADNSGLTRKEFAAAMNQKAKDLGLKKTKFYEMTGLSSNNVSTPKEFAVLAGAAFADPRIADSTQVSNYSFDVISVDGTPRTVNVANRNYSLLAMGADASKTGYLVEAQRNVALKKNGNIIVILHAFSTVQRNTILNKLMSATQLSYNQ